MRTGAERLPPRKVREPTFHHTAIATINLLQPYLYSSQESGRAVLQQHCRRVATRYAKLAADYPAFVQLASIRLCSLMSPHPN